MVFSYEETAIQTSIVNYLNLFDDVFVFTVPNAAKRNAREASVLKKQGMKSGISDLVLLMKNKVIFIEIKTQKKTSVLSPTQKMFRLICNKFGLEYQVWRSIDDAINFINERIRK